MRVLQPATKGHERQAVGMGLSTKTSALGAAQYHAGPAVPASVAQYALDLHQHMRRGASVGRPTGRATSVGWFHRIGVRAMWLGSCGQ